MKLSKHERCLPLVFFARITKFLLTFHRLEGVSLAHSKKNSSFRLDKQ